MDPTAFHPGAFPPPHFPLPPGLNLLPPPPPPPLTAPPQEYGVVGYAQQPKYKGKKRKKNGQNAPNAPPPKSNLPSKKKKGPKGLPGTLPPRPVAQRQNPYSSLLEKYPSDLMLDGQLGFNNTAQQTGLPQLPQLPPHEQQFLGQLQALIQSHHHPPLPTGPSAHPVAATAQAPDRGNRPTHRAPPTGPKPKPRRGGPPSGPRGSGPDRSVKLPPSRASGGVPDATHAYLATSSLRPFPSPTPRPLLVIIDLNGTLIHRPSRRTNPTNFHARPHTAPFLNYVITTFTTMIWSSAKPENVRSVTDRLVDPSIRASLLAVWGRDTFGLTEKDYNDRVQCYKRLTKVWENGVVGASHPMGEVWDQTNTVLIDDSFEKARSEPHNLIEIPEFSGNEGAEEDILPQVHTYLNTLSMQGDVSRYMRQNPFRAQRRGE
ncbi:uncharacterized protein DNG_00745 [Cephalotrichum gorgonifer]|uniref:Mitochondrial import inner membrane translocase subunit TIM50 n=1 Tax=Cephalotrichum gorgonifer TaxID=2041049 RepID=A0AAE8MQV7_9PEZI|nr:uncharacterized protein DNG_00745 [Cephalotrichum gorgonifer]